MSAGFTPGPWRVSGKATINGERGWIASVSQFNRDANAHLIAAAPDLLEAAERALAICLRDFGPDAGNTQFFQNVVAKARGEA